MSTLEELDDLDRRERDDKDKKNDKNGDKNKKNKDGGDAEMKDAEPEEDDVLDQEILSLSTADIAMRKRLLENDTRIMRSEYQRLAHEKATMAEKIKENMEKIANNRYGGSRTQTHAAAPADCSALVNSPTSSATSWSS